MGVLAHVVCRSGRTIKQRARVHTQHWGTRHRPAVGKLIGQRARGANVSRRFVTEIDAQQGDQGVKVAPGLGWETRDGGIDEPVRVESIRSMWLQARRRMSFPGTCREWVSHDGIVTLGRGEERWRRRRRRRRKTNASKHEDTRETRDSRKPQADKDERGWVRYMYGDVL